MAGVPEMYIGATSCHTVWQHVLLDGSLKVLSKDRFPKGTGKSVVPEENRTPTPGQEHIQVTDLCNVRPYSPPHRKLTAQNQR